MRKRLERAAAALLRIELPVVLLAAAAGVAATSALPLAVAVIGLMLIVRAFYALSTTGRLQIAHTPADLPLLLLAGTLLITLWATPRIDITLPQVLRLLTGMGVFLALTNNAERISQRATLVAASVALLGVLLTISMPFTVEWSAGASKFAFIPASVYQRFSLIVSDGVNPNVMAGAIVLLFPVAASQVLAAPSQAQRILFAIAALTMLAGVVLAGSRSALIAAIVTVFVLLMIQARRRSIRLLIGAMVCMALCLVVAGLLFVPGFSAFVNGLLASNDVLSGSQSRMEIWSRAIYMIQDFPFTGIGMGLFAPVADLLYPMIISRSGIEHAHNLILQIAVDLGLPGLVAWLAVYFVVMACLLSQIWRKAMIDKALAIGLFGAQIALVLGGVTDAVTWGMVRSAPLVWGLWGLSIAIWLSVKRHDDAVD